MLDVAAAAGLSRSAVSLALRGHPSIPLKTRERVHAAARRLGYRKNPLVAALMSFRRSGAKGPTPQGSLAFLTSHNPPKSWRLIAHHRRVHAAARVRCAQLGYRLDEFPLADASLRPERLAGLLQARGVHGLLVAPLPGDQTRLNFDVRGFATVGLGMSVREPSIDRVAGDLYRDAQLAFAHCLALGYRRIGLALAADVSRRLEDRWWAGYLVAQQGLAPRSRIPALMPRTQDAVPEQLNAWIARHQVEAVIFSIRHPGVMAVAPSGVGLISLSVQEAASGIAGIRQNTAQVGADAIDLLVAKLHRWNTGPASSPRLHVVPGEWRDGLSALGPGERRRALVLRNTPPRR